MFIMRRKFIKKNVDSLTDRNKILDRNAVLMNTIVSSEIAIDNLTRLKELVKTNCSSLSINNLLILGADFELISDYTKTIIQEFDQ